MGHNTLDVYSSVAITYAVFSFITIGLYMTRLNAPVVSARSAIINLVGAICGTLEVISELITSRPNDSPCFLTIWSGPICLTVALWCFALRGFQLIIKYRLQESLSQIEWNKAKSKLENHSQHLLSTSTVHTSSHETETTLKKLSWFFRYRHYLTDVQLHRSIGVVFLMGLILALTVQSLSVKKTLWPHITYGTCGFTFEDIPTYLLSLAFLTIMLPSIWRGMKGINDAQGLRKGRNFFFFLSPYVNGKCYYDYSKPNQK